MNRQEHLEWCKQRAIEYVEACETENAFVSFQSDMRKHKETENHSSLELMTQMFFGGMLSSPAQMRKFIEGFN